MMTRHLRPKAHLRKLLPFRFEIDSNGTTRVLHEDTLVVRLHSLTELLEIIGVSAGELEADLTLACSRPEG